jgi:putative tryptophan/tyrosine transport system substrate-binding protein
VNRPPSPLNMLLSRHTRRREFIVLFGGTAAAWPFSARAQQGERLRRIGVLMNNDNAEARANYAAFLQALKQLGWVDGHNVRIDARWARGQASEIRKYAVEIVALTPDVIVTGGAAAMVPLMEASRTVPIVFVNVADPVGAGYVDTMSRPGGNATGFVQFEYSLSGKWLELLKQIAPSVTRVAVLRDPNLASGIGQFAVIESSAPTLGVEVSAINVRDAGEIERAIATFARAPNGGLILTASALAVTHGDLIVALAAQYKLPAVCYRRYFVEGGGLISYGYDVLQQFQSIASYVDRILKGEKPADLPVQAPTKYELVVNLKTANALNLTIPQALLATADKVIE